MHRTQFDQLRREWPKKYHSYNLPPADLNIMLRVTTGRYKGKNARLLFIDGSELTVQHEDNKPVSAPYTKLERLDENGEPVIAHSLDITGRPVTGNEVVCYSIGAGNNSHALEIGKVVKTNPSGTLTVTPIIHNGEKILPGGFRARDRSSIRADRVIILPVDATMVCTWVLSSFELYKTDLVDS